MHLDVKRLIDNNHNNDNFVSAGVCLCSSNILLDNCLRAKLADFGLAKVMPTLPPDKSYLRVDSVRGSRAYIADEYFEGELSPKLDVHSFGVVNKTN
jgi:serine/threonine protein kinase